MIEVIALSVAGIALLNAFRSIVHRSRREREVTEWIQSVPDIYGCGGPVVNKRAPRSGIVGY